jgi:hypothetical protein
MAKLDLTHCTYGQLFVLHEVKAQKYNRYWLCRCSCGTIKKVRQGHLRQGKIISCGCYDLKRKTKHNAYKSRLYTIWADMKQRCNNPKQKAYVYYGAKGITICDSWNQDFQTFQQWALLNGYSNNLTIDRINTYKGYCPTNCRWATKTTQSRNKQKQCNNTSGYIGVSFDKQKKKWKSQISVNKKEYFLGRFLTAIEAAQARDQFIKTNLLQNYKLNF